MAVNISVSSTNPLAIVGAVAKVRLAEGSETRLVVPLHLNRPPHDEEIGAFAERGYKTSGQYLLVEVDTVEEMAQRVDEWKDRVAGVTAEAAEKRAESARGVQAKEQLLRQANAETEYLRF